MRCVTAAFVLCGLAALFPPSVSSAAPLDLDTIIVDETPEQICDRPPNTKTRHGRPLYAVIPAQAGIQKPLARSV